MKELKQEYWSSVTLKEKWETAISGRRTHSVQEETPVVLNTSLVLVKEHNHPFSTLRAPTHTDGGKHYIFPSPRGVGPSGLKGKRPCEKFHGGTCAEPSCDFWHPPVCLNYLSESGCKCGDKCKFPHTEAGGQPSKKSKKVGAKGSVAVLEREYSNTLCVPRQSSEKVYSIGCVSHDGPQRKSILRENGQLGSHHAGKFSKAKMRRVKILERRVHRRESFESANLRSEIHRLPNSRKERKTKP